VEQASPVQGSTMERVAPALDDAVALRASHDVAGTPSDERRRWPRGTRTLRYGGDYNPEQWPREVWADDVALMRQAGINMVSVGIFSWTFLEPSEGVYDFSLLDEVLDLLAANGIDVDLGTPTAVPPAWFWQAYPDAAPVTREGQRLGYGARGMAAPTSPEYRRACVALVDRLAERYADHPALAMWHVHNEYGAPVSEDYSDHALRAFRRWLEETYGDLDALNEAWGTAFWGQRYLGWDQVDTPRRAASVTNPAQRLDFARFSSAMLLECFVAERDAIRRHTPDLAVTTNFMATNCPSVDLWRFAREVDVVANDHYLAAERPDNHVLLALDADLTRSLGGGRPWMLMEHSTSAVNWQPRNLAKAPGELARNSLAHVARGADAVMFFQFRASRSGAEKFHSAMLPHAGTASRVWREVVDLGADLERLVPVRGSRVEARVALVWDWESFWAQDLDWRPSVDVRHRERIEAFYAALWRRGVTVDLVHPGADLAAYDLVLAPSLYLLRAEDGAHLARWVEGGGTLLVSYFSGVVDEHDAVHPGGYPGPLRQVLGLSVEEFLPFAEGESARLDGPAPADGATGRVWADDLVLEGAEPVWTFAEGRAQGEPALTRHAHGSGAAWYLATTPDETSLDVLVGRVLEEAGLGERPLLPTGLETVTRTAGDQAYRFLINHATDAVRVDACGIELLTGEPVESSLVVPGGAVRVVHEVVHNP
jgi:beta-galactosidase